MLTAFARFGERTATIVSMSGTKGDKRERRQRGARTDLALGRQSPDDMYAASAAGACPSYYLLAAILLISSSTRQLSCSFS